MNHVENIAFLNTCLDNQGRNVKVRERVELLVMDSLEADMSADEMAEYKKIIKRIQSM